ncbi:hypothetical protein OSB04_025645 [Centaurea solstitialis]|uniref:Uncharacterized protein n=1 Tax=Centaurea solstitialis TaxID=347529 RepID=A0AA38SP26_9ASTR|nr:hypothetical protein OSB04_025645 [Centaurea solstitialis]
MFAVGGGGITSSLLEEVNVRRQKRYYVVVIAGEVSERKRITQNEIAAKENPISADNLLRRLVRTSKPTFFLYSLYTVSMIHFELTAFTDSDHAGCKLDTHNTSDHVNFQVEKLVSWTLMSTSTTEAKYVVAVRCCSQRYNEVPISCDSKSTIAITANPIQHSKTKHIYICYPFIKNQVENGSMEMHFIHTGFQLSDLFIKPLDMKRFNFLVSKPGMLNSSVLFSFQC